MCCLAARSVLLVLVSAATVSCATPGIRRGTPSPDQASHQPIGETTGPFPVHWVIDGDTVQVRKRGETETVRLIGIDAPEVAGPYTEAECYGVQAARQTRELLDGRSVLLEADPSQDEIDRFGRRLAYLWRDDGLLVNQWLIREGLAYEYTYDRDAPYRYARRFRDAEAAARKAAVGLWSEETCAGDPLAPAATDRQ